MTDSTRRRRLMGRRGLQVVRHVDPEEALVAMLEPDTGTLPAVELAALEAGHDEDACGSGCRRCEADVSRETCACPTLRPGESCPAHPFDPSQYVAGGQVPAVVDPAPLEVEDPPPLSPARVLRLEALTAQWQRQVLEAGPDATMLAPFRGLPAVPPARTPAGPPPALEAVAGAWTERGAELMGPADAPARVSDWSSRHDPRSLEGYAVRDRLSGVVPVQDVLLDHGPVLDQGTTPPLDARDAAACTGYAAMAALSVLRRKDGRPELAAGYLSQEAVALYHRAQELDHVSGEEYAGTSVLAVMKAGVEAGHWSTYLWSKSTRDVAQVLLQLRVAVVVGLAWSSGCEEPDARGVIRPTGRPAGGHALAVVGLRRQVAGAPPGPYFVLQQSRGPAEGDRGLVYLHHQDLGRMLAGVGEAAVPVLGL